MGVAKLPVEDSWTHDQGVASCPVAPQGTLTKLLNLWRTLSYAQRACVIWTFSVEISKHNCRMDFFSLFCLSLVSFCMPTWSSNMRFTCKDWFSHSHIGNFPKNYPVFPLEWLQMERNMRHLHMRYELDKSRLESPWTVMNNVQDCSRKYLKYDSLYLKDVIARE